MKVLKWIGIVFVGLIAIGVIGSAFGDNDKQKSSSNSASQAPAAAPISGRIAGHFDRDCFGCGDLKQYISTSDAWCGWQDDKVIVHVRMTNSSVEHVTVTWHPSYTVAGGTDHGTGLTSTEDSGFDAGETRELRSEQQPEGVPPGSALSDCKPSFFLVKSG